MSSTPGQVLGDAEPSLLHAPAPGAWAPPRPVAAASRRARRLRPYHRFALSVLAVNAALALWAGARGRLAPDGTGDLGLIASIAQTNLLLAVMPRQQWMINLVGWAATRLSPRRSLRLRRAAGRYYQVGGVHVGAAIAGTAWYVLSAVVAAVAWRSGTPGVPGAGVALSVAIMAVFVAMCALAAPAVRTRHHDWFEASHRFGGWLVIALVWANLVVTTSARTAGTPLGQALAESPASWLLATSTLLAAWPWLLLRRVPITVERPSSHAAIVRFGGRRPPVGTTRAISRHPLFGWHHFACVPAAEGESGYRMLVSRAGDWTSGFIDDPPTHVWVRGVPVVGVANVKRLFERVVYVVTGSGIGPALGHLLTDTRGARLVWVTRDPNTTYGEALVAEVLRAQPEAIVWNSDERGKPDVLQLAAQAVAEAGADAVICISNPAVTFRVVDGIEQRGIPAFGPIWDS